MGGLSSFFKNVSNTVSRVAQIAAPLAVSYFSGGVINATSGVSGAMNQAAAEPQTVPAASAYTPSAVQAAPGMSTKTMLMIGGGIAVLGLLAVFAMRK
jgi:hypothetical protein